MAIACAAAVPTTTSRQARVHRAIECSRPAPDEFFLVGDDPAGRAPIDSGAVMRFVRYDGETIRVLAGCSAPATPGSLGAYACSTFMDPYDSAFEVDTARMLCEKFPLAVDALASRFEDGAILRARVSVSTLCTATRPSVRRGEVADIDGCRDATHFVYAYDLGALELSVDDVVVATETRGNLSKCGEISMREMRTCKVPIRVELRPIEEGGG